MKDRSDDPSHHERMLLPRSYISLHFYEETLLPMRINSKASTNIFFPLGKMIGMVRLRIRFIPTSQSWEIGSPPTGGAGRMKLSCVVPATVIRIWLIHTSWGKTFHLCVSTVSVFWQFATLWMCNHFAQERKDIFGRRDVESFIPPHTNSVVFKTNRILL